jgi:Tol biopolymer transport system component
VRLAWLDFAAPPVTNACPQVGKHFGFIARDGDDRGAANPTWSRDGETIVYSSAPVGQDGRLEMGPSDLYQVPFNAKAGGAAVPLPFAAEPGAEEYYPAFSPDDHLIAYTRVPAGQEMFANPSAEMWIVPHQTGAQPQRLTANDPPKCSGKMSPGVNNHWPKWSPDRATVGNQTYYWLIFSSNRYGLPPVTTTANGQTKTVQVSQLYITAVVADETSISTRYPAIYLWNQPQSRLNTTPAWDNFHIPIVVD